MLLGVALAALVAGCTAAPAPAGEPLSSNAIDAPAAALPAESVSSPVPLAPADGSGRLDPTRVILSWLPSTDSRGNGLSYDVTLNGATVCSGPAASCVVTDLAQGTTYAWVVTARSGTGASASSGAWSFRTDAAPGRVAIAAGHEGTEQLPLSFSVAEAPVADPDGDPVRYDVVARNPDGGVASACRAVAEPACALTVPRFGRTYAIEITPSDGLLQGPISTFHVTTRLPIVLVHGWNGDSSTWDGLRESLVDEGYPVLDFTSITGGPSLHYDTSVGGIAYEASKEVAPDVAAALRGAGYPAGQRFDVVAHSMGGLVTRWLVEHAGERITEAGTAVQTPTGWSAQVRTLTMLATPNHGANFDCGSTACKEMTPGSDFLGYLGYRAGARAAGYRTLAGDADQVVDATSASLDDVPASVFHRVCHSAGYGFFCDYPIVRAPQTLTALDAVLATRPGPS